MAACWLLGVATAAAQDAEPTTFHLTDGTVVVGRVIEEDDTRVRVSTAHLGEVVLETSSIAGRGAPPPIATPGGQNVQAPPAPANQTVQRATWQRTFTFSGSFISAPFDQGELDPRLPGLTGAALGLTGRQLSVQAAVSIRRVTPDDAFALTGSDGYLHVQPQGMLNDSYTLDAEYTRRFSPRTYGLSRTTFRQEEVRGVDNALLESLAMGFVVTQTPRVRFDLLPGIVVHRESKGTIYDNDVLASLGGMAALAAHLSTTASLEARFVGRRNLQHSGIYAFESYTGVQGALTRRLALTVGLTWNFDSLLGESAYAVPAGALFAGSPPLRLFATKEHNVQLTTGLQVTF